jgi:hypothetical protein
MPSRAAVERRRPRLGGAREWARLWLREGGWLGWTLWFATTTLELSMHNNGDWPDAPAPRSVDMGEARKEPKV